MNYFLKNKHGYYRLTKCCDKIQNECCNTNRCCDNYCINERVARKNKIGEYIDVCYSDINKCGKRDSIQPIPKLKSLVIQRDVIKRENKTKDGKLKYKRMPYSYSITELIRNQRLSPFSL